MRLTRLTLATILTAGLGACGVTPDLDVPDVAKRPVRHEQALGDLTSFVTHLAGAPPFDCGQYPLIRKPATDITREELNRSLTCGLDTQRDGWHALQVPL